MNFSGGDIGGRAHGQLHCQPEAPKLSFVKWLPIAFRRLSSQFTLPPDDVTVNVTDTWLKLDSSEFWLNCNILNTATEDRTAPKSFRPSLLADIQTVCNCQFGRPVAKT